MDCCSVGGTNESSAVDPVVTVCSFTFGKNASSDAEPAMKTRATTAVSGVVMTDFRSRAKRDGSEPSDIEMPPETMKMPMTVAYVVRQSGQALPMTKNDA